MNPVMQLSNADKAYRLGEYSIQALHQVSLSVFPGEMAAVMGASGSGKSTLMNILGCLDQLDNGDYSFGGMPVQKLLPDQLAALRNEKIGFVFQGFHLLPRTTALENVEMPLFYNRTKNRSQYQKLAMEALERVGLSDRIHHHPNQLSGGQQQRVAIARALAGGPSVILADEPTGNLDTRTSLEIIGLFQKLNSQGITVVLVTHEPDIAAYAKRRITMRDGAVMQDLLQESARNALRDLEAFTAKLKDSGEKVKL